MINEKSNKIINIYEMEKNIKDLNKKSKERNYGIDLLRIFSMINIINMHINVCSKQLYLNISSPKFKAIWFLEVFVYPAVNCFGIISGIVGFPKYKFSNLIYIWLIVCFYSISISSYLFFVQREIDKKTLFLSLFPILIKRHWYVNAYFYMYVLLPFINVGISSINRNFHKNTVIFFIFFYSIYYLISRIEDLNQNFNFLINGYSSMWLLVLYIIGAYFGKYVIIDQNKTVIVFLLNLLIFFFTTLFSSELHYKLTKSKNKKPKILISYISPIMVTQAISLVMIFAKLNIRNKILKKIISFLTPLTFSAKLIHTRLFNTKLKIIKILFKWVFMFDPQLLFFKIYCVGIMIYFICICADYIRFLIFKILKVRELSLFIEKIIPKLINKIL